MHCVQLSLNCFATTQLCIHVKENLLQLYIINLHQAMPKYNLVSYTSGVPTLRGSMPHGVQNHLKTPNYIFTYRNDDALKIGSSCIALTVQKL